MASRLNPYLNVADGKAREAITHYQDVFGGELDISTFGEYGMADTPQADQIMHAQLETPAGFTLMISDLPPGMEMTVGDNVSVSISGDDDSELRGYWEKLSKGSKITMPLEKQAWGDTFGSCVDAYGINWMVNISQP